MCSLQELLVNGQIEVPIDDLRAFCTFTGGYHANSRAVHWLWQWLRNSTNEERGLFLQVHTHTYTHACALPLQSPLVAVSRSNASAHTRQFATGMNRIPLDGFDPPFQICKGSEPDPGALPKAHTCFNMFVLPDYATYSQLKQKVAYAIKNTNTFELS